MRTRDTEKEQLVKQKAIENIVKYGFEGFSMNKLAKACGISVATLYIYYKDRDDLIIKVAMEEGDRMGDAMLKGFDPESSFEDGLWVQWKNRYEFMTQNYLSAQLFEQLRSSTYHEEFMSAVMERFKMTIGKFMQNVVARGEMNEMPLEVYWSVAFAPLYSLVRFHNEGRSIGGKAFIMNDELLQQAFNLVLKALKN
ncbi:TetR/AcrR family transcriptional regulator [Mucilaginibacter paludis]|uniref:Regulatory protein TetR n=1 Tax=Mucilaginibacter paludis DSM 18603 TaxID=714943 RepID=H1YCA6_9SPHI|nr:TetR/AcrR family transcriptional regulator [Mucilaginibacter paludis]EHQ30097.1 regulatory protein TetR [Mucilaginibacter paludis DSM 18603]